MDRPEIGFAQNLRALRTAAGLSRSDLAAGLGYTEKAVEKWEAGKSVPPLPVLCGLSRMLGVSLDALARVREPGVRFYLGIDGGGTKTEFLLEDGGGRELARRVLGPSNPNDVGMAASQRLIESGIAEVCGSMDHRGISMFAGIAGAMSGDNTAVYRKFFERFGFGCADCGSDVENALELTLGGGDGVAVIIGTGCIAFAQKNGVRRRVGGWGYLIDAGGSGFNFGQHALEAALKQVDGTGPDTLLSELLAAQLGKSVPDAIPEIYAGGKQKVASLAPTVFEACGAGDPAATEILRRNAAHIASLIRRGLAFSGGPAALCGGLCRQEKWLRPLLEEQLPGTELRFLTEPAVHGAVRLARREKPAG